LLRRSAISFTFLAEPSRFCVYGTPAQIARHLAWRSPVNRASKQLTHKRCSLLVA
jgi:hypothetical protein